MARPEGVVATMTLLLGAVMVLIVMSAWSVRAVTEGRNYNPPALEDGGKTAVASDHVLICIHMNHRAEQGGKWDTVHLYQDWICSDDSTGNALGVYFYAREAARAYGLGFKGDCNTDHTVQQLLPQALPPPDNITVGATDFSRYLCDECDSGTPHTCRGGFQRFIAGAPRADLDAGVAAWRAEHADVELDEAAIHVRCGDILRIRHHAEYGFAPYYAYTKYLDPDLKSIGIITASFNCAHGRRKDCPFAGTCRHVAEDLRDFLREQFPDAKVTIRNDDAEDAVTSFARLFLARQSFCNPSTFCLYPTLLGRGHGMLVASRLYPWVEDVAAEVDSEVLQVPILNMKMIVHGRMDGPAIANYLRNAQPRDLLG